MFHRFRVTRLVIAALAGLTILASCGPPPGPSATVQSTQGADPALAADAAILQRSILVEAALGPTADALGTQTFGNDLFGMSVTTTVGTVSGTYLGFLQQRYLTEAEILGQVRSDLARNNRQVEATLGTMRSVVSRQRNGQTTDDAAGRANLSEMQRAITGATNRLAEFQTTRVLLPTTTGSQIDPQLAALSRQIAEMRAVAGDMAGLL
jgi:hypothetical protein